MAIETASTEILFDVSRLYARSARLVPTGIDRVELSYAKHFIETAGDRVRFLAIDLLDRIGCVDYESTRRFVTETNAKWDDGRNHAYSTATRFRPMQLHARLLWKRLRYPAANLTAQRSGLVYILVSHHHLDRPNAIRSLKDRSGALFVCMIHDLIPIEWPEYARPGHDQRHTSRMETVASLCDGIIANSSVTAAAFQPFLERADRNVPVCVAPLGVKLRRVSRPPERLSDRPYFVCIGTIEPRKNHLMLLALWRQLAHELGGDAPRLILVGQRGWEYENIADLLDRSPTIRRTVEEQNSMSDAELSKLLSGARALLLPSFVEGYGLPVAEALAASVPVICSNIPALREVGGAVPEYLDPLDGLGWKTVIREYMGESSTRRAAQLARLSDWQPPTWKNHFEIVDKFLETLAIRG